MWLMGLVAPQHVGFSLTRNGTFPNGTFPLGFSCGSVKNPPTMWETWVLSLGWEDALEKGKATHSSILAGRIPWTVQSIGLQRVVHD